MSQPTILQVLPRLNAGGVERGTLDIAHALVKAGWQSLVASQGGSMVDTLIAEGSQHFFMPLAGKNPLTLYGNAQRLCQLIRQHKADLVHVRSRAPAWSVKWAAQQCGIPWVSTFHGTYSLGPLSLKKPYNAIMTQADRVIAGSQFIAQHIQQHYGLDTSAITLIPRGVDMATFDPKQVPADQINTLQGQWQLDWNKQTLLLPGRITHWKGQMVLLQALAQLPADAPPWQAILLGSTTGRESYVQAVDRMITDLHLTDHVKRVDHTQLMPAAYRIADIVISASTDPEAFGRVAAEASAMTNPIIASAHGGSLETVLGGQSGWLVPPGDINALSHCLLTALQTSPEQRQAMGKAGRDHIQQHFSLAQMCQLTLDCYRGVLA